MRTYLYYIIFLILFILFMFYLIAMTNHFMGENNYENYQYKQKQKID